MRDSITLRELCGNEATEAIELREVVGGVGFADELDEAFGYGRNDDFSAEEEAEMYELFGRPRSTDEGPDRTPPAGAMSARLAA